MKAKALIGAGALLVTSSVARAGNPLVEFPERPERLRAFAYASASNEACLAELEVRRLPFKEGPPVPSIAAPVRLTGPIRGVTYEFFHPTARAAKDGPVMDCRLLLALDDLATVAFDRGIRRIRYNSVYRGRYARRPGQRHAAGVAIDIVELVDRDGQRLNIKRDFHGAGLRSKTCGEGAPAAPPGVAARLRKLVCDIDASGSFNLLLTPHYDVRHDDHLHLEVRRGIRWRLTQ